jgi:hypothetical protein
MPALSKWFDLTKNSEMLHSTLSFSTAFTTNSKDREKYSVTVTAIANDKTTEDVRATTQFSKNLEYNTFAVANCHPKTKNTPVNCNTTDSINKDDGVAVGV